MRKITLKGLRKKADAALSKYICKRDNGICVTCTKPGNQAGHFIGRGFYGTRYDEINVHCQDYRCNICLKSNMISYYEFMERTYGKKVIRKLEKQSHWTLVQFVQTYINAGVTTTREAYEVVIQHYTYKLEKI